MLSSFQSASHAIAAYTRRALPAYLACVPSARAAADQAQLVGRHAYPFGHLWDKARPALSRAEMCAEEGRRERGMAGKRRGHGW